MAGQDIVGVDRELQLVVTTLQRLAVRVGCHFNPDMTEGTDVRDEISDARLAAYAQRCLDILDDPGVTSRLMPAYQSRW
ncbi:hypothetical protein BKG80_05875 [Mycobacteroides chelonae]|uniref:hypothetical protein n=1 Tax=Mycobacteroides chelonae TaxID=1774 RepID=UPI0008A8C63C|nr:hypothetical protein [Mycobacteroides chelonae]MBF9352825.1 hypothetical protein [Mycobacteroides chelonae]OHU42433.1 hypothetical protein BKG80_05875 [Mycobacteroides chelonae]